MCNSMHEYIISDLKTILPSPEFEYVIKLYKLICEVCETIPGDHLLEKEVGLLYNTTYSFPKEFHDRMCIQRGVKSSEFKSYDLMKSYTSAEFAKERYNINDTIYMEIINMPNIDYISKTKKLINFCINKM